MRAAVLRGVHDLVVEERPDPVSPVAPGYARVRIQAVGLCGSDVHYYEAGRIGSFVVEAPMILGHEAGGVVEAVGPGVELPVGTVVAIEPGVPCGTCRWCRSGRYNLCPAVKFMATPPVDGAMVTWVDHPAAFLYPAEGLTPEVAALAEPLSVGMHAVRRAGISVGMDVGVMGAGPVGILAALAAETAGARPVVFDVVPDRIQAAQAMGFDARPFPPDANAFDAVLECSGAEAAVAAAPRAAAPGGTVALIGLGTEAAMRVDGLTVGAKELNVVGIFRYANVYPASLAVLRRQRDRLAPLLARQIDLAELPAYLAANRHREAVKTIVRVAG
jgi:L-iditol 2-dehydrogenase